MNESLQTTLKRLRLSGLASSLEIRLQEASGNGLNHIEFLELILQDELAVRADRLMERRIKAASFRDPRTLEDFDFAFNPSIRKKQVFDLASCRFIREVRDVLLLGPPLRFSQLPIHSRSARRAVAGPAGATDIMLHLVTCLQIKELCSLRRRAAGADDLHE